MDLQTRPAFEGFGCDYYKLDKYLNTSTIAENKTMK
jgi:hypothetical protein